MKCSYCGKEEALPYFCSYCQRYHCSEHRLPENHNCDGIRLAKAPLSDRTVTQGSIARQQRGGIYVQLTRRLRRISIDRIEATHLTVGSGLVLLAGLSLFGFQRLLIDPAITVSFGLAFAASFLAHELAHKYVAMREGCSAFFRLDPFGAMLTAITSFLPIKFIAPGAVRILGHASPSAIARIAAAGPITNVSISLGIVAYLLLTWYIGPSGTSLSIWGIRAIGYLNALMAVFNMVPFGPLDGLKVMLAGVRYWAVLFGICAAVFMLYLLRAI